MLNQLSNLNITLKIDQPIPNLIQNMDNLININIPTSIEWDIIPNETEDHNQTMYMLAKLGNVPNIKSIVQRYMFAQDGSNLGKCYPVWANFMTPSYQNLEKISVSVLLGPEFIDQFNTIFGLGIQSMN